MRILLDESLPRPLRDELTGHSVKTVAEMGWSAIENGELLRRAAGRFDAFPLTVIVLAARTNRLEDLRPLIPDLLSRLGTPQGKSFLRIGAA